MQNDKLVLRPSIKTPSPVSNVILCSNRADSVEKFISAASSIHSSHITNASLNWAIEVAEGSLIRNMRDLFRPPKWFPFLSRSFSSVHLFLVVTEYYTKPTQHTYTHHVQKYHSYWALRPSRQSRNFGKTVQSREASVNRPRWIMWEVNGG